MRRRDLLIGGSTSLIAGNSKADILLLGSGSRSSVSAGGPAATTWNPADKAGNIVLSGGNLAANDAVDAVDSVRSITSLTAGQLAYFQYTNTTNTFGGWVGFSTNASPLNNSALGWGGSPSTAFIFQSNASFRCADSVDHLAVWAAASWVNGDIVDIAFNSATGKAWGRLNNVNWNNNALADPAAGIGGFAVPFAGPYFGFAGGDVFSSAVAFASGSWINVPPVGYSQINA